MRILGRICRRIVRTLGRPDPLIETVKPFTMLTPDRLMSLLKLSMQIAEDGLPGAFVECGTCRGGSAAILAYVARQEGWKRDLYLFDSFQGHPRFVSDEAPDRGEVIKWAGTMIASQEDVKAALHSVEAYEPQHIHIVPGWFQESLPTVNIPEIALLHLDADWYDSTLYCLRALYDKVIPLGYIQIDDYRYYEGCRLAVDEFLADRGNEVSFSYVGVALVLRKRQVSKGHSPVLQA